MKRDLAALTAREHDLLVIGGGIYGAAAAWDAAQRGLSVALLEAGDFGAATSWSSLKTIHGGLRHLQRGDIASLRASMQERRALLRIAPELVKPLRFLAPTSGHGTKGREALGIGLLLNDLLTPDRNRDLPQERQIPPGRLLSRAQVLELAPGLRASDLNGGACWTDAQVESSERLLLGFLHAAAGAGAVLANHAPVRALLDAGGRVHGARAWDALAQSEFEVRARMVLNAAGPGVDAVLRMAGVRPVPVPLLRATNLVLGRCPLASHAIGARSGDRYLFLVPWRGQALVGTDYEPVAQPPGSVASFLEQAQRAFPWADLQLADVRLVHRGLVPGAEGASGLWLHHRVLDHETRDRTPGLWSLVGVKYTTARGVAEAAIDRIVRRMRTHAAACRTAVTPLPQARLLAGPLTERARHAAREEMAFTLADAVRRLDVGSGGPPSEPELQTIAETLAGELGWDAARQQQECETVRASYRIDTRG